MTLTNIERAMWGEQAIEAGTPDENEQRVNLIDTLANIMHACDHADRIDPMDFDSALENARHHYAAEVFEAAEGQTRR